VHLYNCEKHLLASSCLSVCLAGCPSVRLSIRIGVAPTERILVKLNIGDFYGSMKNSKSG
jgi:hypothetical protein